MSAPTTNTASSGVVALYGDVNTVAEVEVPQFARPAMPAGRSIDRDQYGRPLIVPPGESAPAPYTRASSEAGYLTDGNALRVWQTRRLAVALTRYPDLLMRIAVLRPEADEQVLEFGDAKAELARAKADRADLDELITRALDRDGTLSKADWGTAMHKLSEPTTPRDYVPDVMRPDLDAYDHALASRGITRVESEVFLVNDRWRIAGTTDGVFDVPGWGRVVGDLKTGQLHPVQHAVQLGAYAGADRFDPDAPAGQQRTPLNVRQDVGLLIHSLKGTARCELFLIDLEHGRRNIALAEQVRDARRSAGLARPFDDVVPFPDYTNVPQRVVLGIDAAVVGDEFVQQFEATESLLDAHHVGGENDPREQADPGYLEDAATEQAPPPYDNGGTLPAGFTPVTVAPDAGLGPRLQREAEHRRLEQRQAEAAARRAAARAQAQEDPDAPAHLKVRTGADVRADAEAAAGPGAPGPAVQRLRRERAEREAELATQYREVSGEHPGVDTLELPRPTTPQQPTPQQPAPQVVRDVNGDPVTLRGDMFDELRVSDPLPPPAEDHGAARGLVTDVLGGVDVTPAQQLAERIALAGSRDEVNALFREFSPRGEWLEEHHQLAQQRVALLGPTG